MDSEARSSQNTARLAGKVTLVTGAGSGIGRAIALLFASSGAKVVALDRNEDSAQETVRAPSSAQGVAICADVAQEQGVAGAMAKTVELFGRLDVLLNNAAIELGLPVTETTVDQWDLVQAVNLRGVFLCCKHAIPAMRAGGGGSIVSVASANALVGVPAHAAYSAAKGGVVALTRQLALDYGPENIRVNCICPTTTDTPMVRAAATEQDLQAIAARHPLRRICEPEDIAFAALFLASEEARCITGVVLPVDAGWTAQ